MNEMYLWYFKPLKISNKFQLIIILIALELLLQIIANEVKELSR